LSAKDVARFLIPVPAVLAALLIFTLVLIYFLAPAAFAAGDDIRVLSSEREVRLGDVVLNLEVEGEADIVEVRLYYRVAPSRVWTYTYPDSSPSSSQGPALSEVKGRSLTPSRHMETSFRLSFSGTGYLPPGTELEYYYSIRDAQGNILETRPETFVYVDDRFRWQTVNAGPLTIFWHDLSERRVQEVARQVEESLYEISELLQASLDKPVKGIIYNSRAEAQEAFPHQSRTITQEQVFQGFAFPERNVFVGIGLHASLIVHESAHLLLHSVTASPGARVPAWVNEGFASYVESGAHGDGRGFPGGASPGFMPLKHMSTVPGRPEAIQYFYRKAESVVGYLLEVQGAPKFRTFLSQLDEGNTAEKALMAAYGFGLDELDQRWSLGPSQGERNDASGDGPSPFAYIDTLLIGGLALVVAMVIIVGFMLRRLRKRSEGPDEQDGLTEDEWEGRP